jgi:hypothetical protein
MSFYDIPAVDVGSGRHGEQTGKILSGIVRVLQKESRIRLNLTVTLIA